VTSITALAALALAVFSIGTTEFVVPGLLPEIATDLGASIPRTGLLVTGYAAGVAVGGTLLVVLTRNLSQKTTLLLLVGIFAAGHVMAAVAPSYEFLMAARILTSFCHGAFVGVASVVAMQVVAADRKAMAVAVVWVGFCLASIVGLPAGTALGHAYGWRATMWIVGILGLAAGLGIAAFVPARLTADRSDLRSELAVLSSPQLLLALAISMLLTAGTLSVFTHIVPFLVEATGISKEVVRVVLFAFVVGGTISMFIGARFADWKLLPTVVAILVALRQLSTHAGVQTNPVLTTASVVVWGFLVYAPAAPIQVRIVTLAEKGPNLASTLNQSAFNIGNAVGPFLGAAMLTSGFGFGSLPWAGLPDADGGDRLGDSVHDPRQRCPRHNGAAEKVNL
jgi:MFS transporter, DHA1 family, inner membrane transport protein